MNMEKYINMIKNIELFSKLNHETLTQILHSSKSKIQHYERDQIIHFNDEICYAIDIILDGKVVAQHIDKDGNVLIINTFIQKDTIGSNLIFSDCNVYPMTIAAASKCTILHIKKELILELFHTNEDFLINFLKNISYNAVILADRIKTISTKSIRQKIIDYLRSEYLKQGSLIIQIDTTKKELAERLGIQRTSLSRELNKMRKSGLLDFTKRTITVKDLNLLS
ncbi:MAG: hypothetical protein PWP67_2034 [Clostridium butyricum]|nr:hypothetical protein [Thermoanaerobacterium sp.]MDK2829219.1 hypothetical protein [Clostridium butyricum]MDK2840366.1 hypothetical protein [Thermosipho sp. (in: thermotogales)]